MLTEEKFLQIDSILNSYANDNEGLEKITAAAITLRGNNTKRELRREGKAIVVDAIGVISKRMGMFSDISGGTSTESLGKQFDEALASDARAIIFNVDSPGGAAYGAPEFADKVFEAARKSDKTIITCTDGQMCSAAYYFGSQANEVYLTRGSEVGSIGVIATITDDSRKKLNEGVRTEVIKTSPLKGAGGGYEPLNSTQIKSIQERVDAMGQMFYADVMRARGSEGLDLKSFDPASVFKGEKAVQMGLCDGIATLDQILKRYA